MVYDYGFNRAFAEITLFGMICDHVKDREGQTVLVRQRLAREGVPGDNYEWQNLDSLDSTADHCMHGRRGLRPSERCGRGQ